MDGITRLTAPAAEIGREVVATGHLGVVDAILTRETKTRTYTNDAVEFGSSFDRRAKASRKIARH